MKNETLNPEQSIVPLPSGHWELRTHHKHESADYPTVSSYTIERVFATESEAKEAMRRGEQTIFHRGPEGENRVTVFVSRHGGVWVERAGFQTQIGMVLKDGRYWAGFNKDGTLRPGAFVSFRTPAVRMAHDWLEKYFYVNSNS